MEGDTAGDWQFVSGAASLNGIATFMVLPLLYSSRKVPHAAAGLNSLSAYETRPTHKR